MNSVDPNDIVDQCTIPSNHLKYHVEESVLLLKVALSIVISGPDIYSIGHYIMTWAQNYNASLELRMT